jgi:hypothetical protein
MSIARLTGGPLDGQLLPFDGDDDEIIAPYGEGQIVYRRSGDAVQTGAADGPTEVSFAYVEATEPINPDPDGRDE